MSESDPTIPAVGITAAGFAGALSVEDVLRFEAGEGLNVPVQSPFQKISGLYRGTSTIWRIDLRLDVDGRRPLRRISGDFFRGSGKLEYHGSFVVDTPAIQIDGPKVTIEGMGRFNVFTDASRIRVIVSRKPLGATPGTASLTFLQANGTEGETYTCSFESLFFRTVEIEEDVEQNVAPFAFHDIGSPLAPVLSPRRLTIPQVYADSGIRILPSPISSSLNVGGEDSWSDAELHAAMTTHFAALEDIPQWKVWLLHARQHDQGTGTLGVMFDEQGLHRQGCAVFHNAIFGDASTRPRQQLHTCIHELGHCFNLAHSFEKSDLVPFVADRPSAFSWMNYPWKHPGDFWGGFAFEFDDLELLHLRHAFLPHIIMGGSPFKHDGALESPGLDRASDDNSLELVVEAPKSLGLGEPVWIELKLYLRGTRPRRVHQHLHPRERHVRIMIQKPGGPTIEFAPVSRRCVQLDSIILDEETPSIYESAFIGFGKRGPCFDHPGVYRIRAFYQTLEGSWIVSKELKLRVRSPHNQAEDDLADLLLGDDQGLLICLRGSDAGYLRSGNDALDEVIEQHGEHPFATYARLVKGFNLARSFKTPVQGGEVKYRPSDLAQAQNFLKLVIKAGADGQPGLNNITLNRAMRCLAQGQVKMGDMKGAKKTMREMVHLFDTKRLKPHVLRLVRQQATETVPGW